MCVMGIVGSLVIYGLLQVGRRRGAVGGEGVRSAHRTRQPKRAAGCGALDKSRSSTPLPKIAAAPVPPWCLFSPPAPTQSPSELAPLRRRG